MYSGHTATHIPDIWLSSISASTCCLSDGGSELRNDPGSCDVSGPADAAACRACSARCTANTCHIDRYIVITAQQGHLSSIPLIQFWIGIPGKTHSKTYSVSLTKYAWELQNDALRDILRHGQPEEKTIISTRTLMFRHFETVE